MDIRMTFEPKHGTASRWNVCDCRQCDAARPWGPRLISAPAQPSCSDTTMRRTGGEYRWHCDEREAVLGG